MGKTNYSKPQKSKKHKKLKKVDDVFTLAWRDEEGSKSQKAKPNRSSTSQRNSTETHHGKRRFSKRPNEKPSDPDSQEIPFSVREIIRTKKNVDFKTKKKIKHKHYNVEGSEDTGMEKGSTRKVQAPPRFVQGKRESEKQFFYRMDRVAQSVINQAKFEEKYQVDVEKNKNNETIITKRKTEKTKEKTKKNELRKKEQKLLRSEKKKDDFEHLQDTFKFGDVVMAPPSLTAKPRKAGDHQKKGKKNLLLLDIMQENQANNPSKVKTRELGKTTKRKNLSMAQQVILDGERNRAIELYRKMKKNVKTKVT